MSKEMKQVHQNLRRAISTFLPSSTQHAVSFTARNHRAFQKPYLSNRSSKFSQNQWRGELTEGFLRYEFGGLIFVGAYTWRILFSEF